MAVASLVLGILSIVFALLISWLGYGWAAVLFGIAGIVLASVELSRKDPATKGKAIAGLVCSIVGLVLGAILWIGLWILATIFKFVVNVI